MNILVEKNKTGTHNSADTGLLQGKVSLLL